MDRAVDEVRSCHGDPGGNDDLWSVRVEPPGWTT